MWRTNRRMPERGRIGIFNRSYYEEVLVVRVHPDLLEKQKLPPSLVTKKIWKERFEDINDYERYLTRNGVLIRKFFLNVSKEEQKKRFLERLDNPNKNWKFSVADARERGTLGRLHGSLRRYDPEYGNKACAMVCGTGGQEVVHPPVWWRQASSMPWTA
jgi:polyphosphate kinase 2 (PPK2 family)